MGCFSYRRAFFLITSLCVAGILIAGRTVLAPFFFGLVLAYVLTPCVRRMERLGVSRGLSIVFLYLCLFGSLGVFFRCVTPHIFLELKSLRKDLPAFVVQAKQIGVPWMQEKIEHFRALGIVFPTVSSETEPFGTSPAFWMRERADGVFEVYAGDSLKFEKTDKGFWLRNETEKTAAPSAAIKNETTKFLEEILEQSLAYAQRNAPDLFRLGRDMFVGIGRCLLQISLALMVGAYLMLTRERILAFLESLFDASARDSFWSLLQRIDQGLSGVVRGQLVICVINGALSALGFWILGIKYWHLLALIATVFSLIPIFGAIVSSLPALALGLMQSWGTAVSVFLWILCIHQIEANVLNPKIMGDAAKIHPVLVVLALLLGEHFFSMTGALLAVPVLSIALSIFDHFRMALDTQQFASPS